NRALAQITGAQAATGIPVPEPGAQPAKSRQRRISRPDRLKPTSAVLPLGAVKSAAGVHRQAISLPALPTPDVAHNKYDFPRPFRMGCAHAGAPTPRG